MNKRWTIEEIETLLSGASLGSFGHVLTADGIKENTGPICTIIRQLLEERNAYRKVAQKEYFMQTRMDPEWEKKSWEVVDAKALARIKGPDKSESI